MYLWGCVVSALLCCIFLKQIVDVLISSSLSPTYNEIRLTILFMVCLSWVGVGFTLMDMYAYYKEK